MSENNFLCSSCLSVMCSDCKEIASEYDELLKIRNNNLQLRDRRIDDLERELSSERRLREGYEKTLKAGLPELMKKWIDSQIIKDSAVTIVDRPNLKESELVSIAQEAIRAWDGAGPPFPFEKVEFLLSAFYKLEKRIREIREEER